MRILLYHIQDQNGYNQRKLGTSFTQDDLRIDHQAGPRTSTKRYIGNSGSDSSGDSLHYYANQQRSYHGHQTSSRMNNRNTINKSKSAHVISCEVYAEVADHTEQGHLHYPLTTLHKQRY